MTTVNEALNIALTAWQGGDVARAQKICEEIRARTGNRPDILHLLASLAAASGQTAKAVDGHRQAIAMAAWLRGEAYRAAGKHTEARASYDEAVKVDPYNKLACESLGAMYQAQTPRDASERLSGRRPASLYRTPIGTYFLPVDAPDDIVIRRMRAGKIFEEDIVDAVRPYAAIGTVVLDVGANFGQMSLLFSDFVGRAGTVYSFEADEYIHHILQMNISINEKTNIRAIHAAVYDSCGETVFYPEQDFKRFGSYGSYGIDPQASKGRSVRTVTIDSLAIQEAISLIKVDVQGADLHALRGAVRTIAQHKPAIIFEFEEQFQAAFKTSFGDYMDFVAAIGYRVNRVVNEINYLVLPT
jgi:FkbM family methyltransferase